MSAIHAMCRTHQTTSNPLWKEPLNTPHESTPMRTPLASDTRHAGREPASNDHCGTHPARPKPPKQPRGRSILWFALCLVTLAPAVASASEPIRFEVNEHGLAALSYAGHDMLWERGHGAFLAGSVVLESNDGTSEHMKHIKPTARRLESGDTAVAVYDWGVVKCRYVRDNDALDLVIDVENTSDRTIREINLEQRGLLFPTEPDGLVNKWGFNWAYNTSAPPIIKTRFAEATFALCNEQVAAPAGMGIFHRKQEPDYRIALWTGRLWKNQKNQPFFERPIRPGNTERFRLSIRFGAPDQNPLDLATDVLEKARQAHPFQVNWSDRRPIGMLMVAQSGAQSEHNPRGYKMLKRRPDIDITTEAGRAKFREHLLSFADGVIDLCEQINAQGVVVWDIEGVEYPNAKYMGDPRSLPPEMDAAADAFFKKLRNAGLHVGICVRWGVRPMRWSYGEKIRQFQAPNPTKDMIRKIAHAKERWNCEIFYMDVFPADRPDALQQIKAEHPDVLLLPEHEGVYSYAYGIPYHQVMKPGRRSRAPDIVRRLYPDAGRLLNGFGVALADEDRRADALSAMQAGSIPMARVWFKGDEFAPLKKVMDRKRTDGGSR